MPQSLPELGLLACGVRLPAAHLSRSEDTEMPADQGHHASTEDVKDWLFHPWTGWKQREPEGCLRRPPPLRLPLHTPPPMFAILLLLLIPCQVELGTVGLN